MPVANIGSKWEAGSLVFFNKADGTVLLTIATSGVDIPTFTIDTLVLDSGANLDLNGIADSLILDADGDTTISAPTDDQIDIEVGGSDVLTITAGASKPASGHLPFFAPAQTIDMSDAQVALSIDDANTQITSNVLYVDANSGATEDLLLPPEADCNGLALVIVNTGGEDIVVKEDGDSTTIVTVSANEIAVVTCDGTTWRGGVMATT